jgi:ribose/xylose/arabinose/galactoside ABC-type transport system permease subunit
MQRTTSASPPNPVTSYLPQSRRGTINLITAIVAVALTLALTLTIPNFIAPRNILNILEQLSVLGFMCVGMTYVMVAGGIDLSVYTVVSAAAVVGASVMVADYPPVIGCVLMLCVGVVFGVINGVAIAYGRMTPFIVTLSTMVLAQGFAIWYTSAQSISGLPESYVEAVSGKLFGFFPVPAAIILVVALIAGIVLARTRYGRWIYLTGSNEQTARVSGLPVRFIKFSTYVFSGLMAGITAIVLTAMVGTATTAMVRDERLMDVIATTVIGGASLTGGTGSVLGTMLGLLFITVLGNSFNLLGVSPFIAMVIKGFILVIIIGIDALRTRGERA